MIRVLIADDHQLMREGLKALLARVQDIQVVAEAGDGLEAVDTALRTEPDVVLMDIAMPDIDGLKATEKIIELDKNIRVLLVSAHAEEATLKQAVKSGASGYLIKSANPTELPLAIRAVHGGEMYFSPEVFEIASRAIVNG